MTRGIPRRKKTTPADTAPVAAKSALPAALPPLELPATLPRAAHWHAWFTHRGWTPFPFQQAVWDAYQAGGSGLVHATTGTGKTYAAWGGPLLEWLTASDSRATPPTPEQADTPPTKTTRRRSKVIAPPLRVLWLTPLRALAADTEAALLAPLKELQIPWRLERRTGDTTAAVRARQRDSLPTALITTPESLSLLLTRPDAPEQFSTLQVVIVDEWHELLGTKRGVQTELALARLRKWQPDLRVWGLSATLGNLHEALQVLTGPVSPAATPVPHRTRQSIQTSRPTPQLIQGASTKVYQIDCLIPAAMDYFPWSGHLGLRLIDQVVEAVERGQSTLLFTNTRSQTELWYQALLQARPQWAGLLALHHGSLDQEVRSWVEQGLRSGQLKCVVCTSSLDLGVDFCPVDQVIQIGSPKGVARLLQRAGRSGHQPGKSSRIICVPTNAWELVEFAAVREALAAGQIESRRPRRCPLDVLAQHVVTIALGQGFTSDELLHEVRQTTAYQHLSQDDWNWVLDFVVRGGDSLRAYPDYHRVTCEAGVYRMLNPQLSRRHRMSIGTITSDASVSVHYLRGGRLGQIEESFISKLKPGDAFIFAGKLVELIRVYDMKAYVKHARVKRAPVPRWGGGRMPLSSELSAALRDKLDAASRGERTGPELTALSQIFEIQASWSRIPRLGEVLVEQWESREGHHLFVFPFEGRLVHEGLASLFAFRLAKQRPMSFSIAMNDYGFELLSETPADLTQAISEGLLSLDELDADIAASLNAVEMAKRQFREVARISGLLFQGFPGAAKSTKDLQPSATLLYEVFQEYDPTNKLLRQSHQEVLDQQLETTRLAATLQRLQTSEFQFVRVNRPTPLAFPLLVDRLRDRLTSERLEDRVRRMQAPLDRAATQTLQTAGNSPAAPVRRGRSRST